MKLPYILITSFKINKNSESLPALTFIQFIYLMIKLNEIAQLTHAEEIRNSQHKVGQYKAMNMYFLPSW